MSRDEKTVMGRGERIFQLGGVRFFLLGEFDITEHENHKPLGVMTRKIYLILREYIKQKRKAKMNGNTVITIS